MLAICLTEGPLEESIDFWQPAEDACITLPMLEIWLGTLSLSTAT